MKSYGLLFVTALWLSGLTGCYSEPYKDKPEGGQQSAPSEAPATPPPAEAPPPAEMPPPAEAPPPAGQ